MDELRIFLANAAGGHLEGFLDGKFCVFDRGKQYNNTPNFNNSRRTEQLLREWAGAACFKACTQAFEFTHKNYKKLFSLNRERVAGC
jgi:hypothetical protein